MVNSGKERRRAPRTKVNYPILFASDKIRILNDACIKDISTLGAFIETEVSLSKNDKIVFEFKKPSKPISFTGIVRWRKTDKPKGIGVEFLKAIQKDNITEAVDE